MFYPFSKVAYGDPDPAKMCGDGRIESLQHAPASPNLRAAYVKFVNGVHTKWHYHTGEQLLVGVKGKGFIEFQDRMTLEIHEATWVFNPTGVWRCLGADEGNEPEKPRGDETL